MASDRMPKGIITVRNETHRKQLNYLEVKCMRILKGWTEEERKELKDIENNQQIATMVIFEICNEYLNGDNLSHPALYRKYDANCSYEDDQLAKDIADYMKGDAKFAEQKYYVKLIRNNDESYLNRNMLSNFCSMTCCYQPDDIFKTEFTEQEIKAIDPRYMAFAVPVEEDNE